jgi:hypothetical protein
MADGTMITCLWFDHGEARKAAEFYATVFPDSQVSGAADDRPNALLRGLTLRIRAGTHLRRETDPHGAVRAGAWSRGPASSPRAHPRTREAWVPHPPRDGRNGGALVAPASSPNAHPYLPRARARTRSREACRGYPTPLTAIRAAGPGCG